MGRERLRPAPEAGAVDGDPGGAHDVVPGAAAPVQRKGGVEPAGGQGRMDRDEVEGLQRRVEGVPGRRALGVDHGVQLERPSGLLSEREGAVGPVGGGRHAQVDPRKATRPDSARREGGGQVPLCGRRVGAPALQVQAAGETAFEGRSAGQRGQVQAVHLSAAVVSEGVPAGAADGEGPPDGPRGPLGRERIFQGERGPRGARRPVDPPVHGRLEGNRPERGHVAERRVGPDRAQVGGANLAGENLGIHVQGVGEAERRPLDVEG